ncbi:hypothetical protein ACTXN4_26740 [Pseudomonas helleri]|uniref:hypothetical protein n=1 Tax=Pseudomonas helleri TaxID=1608996 RepID=UPI003FD076AA
MHSVFISDDTSVEVDQVLGFIRAHRIVVLNSFMRVQGRELWSLANSRLGLDKAGSGDLQLFEFEILIDGCPWHQATYVRISELTLKLDQLHNLVERAVNKWLERGRSKHFLYTNNVELDRDEGVDETERSQMLSSCGWSALVA